MYKIGLLLVTLAIFGCIPPSDWGTPGTALTAASDLRTHRKLERVFEIPFLSGGYVLPLKYGNVLVPRFTQSTIEFNKFNVDGTVDTSYGVNGVVKFDTSGRERFSTLAAQFRNGDSLVFLGSKANVLYFARLKFTDGTVDYSFGNHGIQTVDYVVGRTFANFSINPMSDRVYFTGYASIGGEFITEFDRDLSREIRSNSYGALAPIGTSYGGHTELSFLASGEILLTNNGSQAPHMICPEEWTFGFQYNCEVQIKFGSDLSILEYTNLSPAYQSGEGYPNLSRKLRYGVYSEGGPSPKGKSYFGQFIPLLGGLELFYRSSYPSLVTPILRKVHADGPIDPSFGMGGQLPFFPNADTKRTPVKTYSNQESSTSYLLYQNQDSDEDHYPYNFELFAVSPSGQVQVYGFNLREVPIKPFLTVFDFKVDSTGNVYLLFRMGYKEEFLFKGKI